MPAIVDASQTGLSNTQLIGCVYDCNRTSLYRANFADPVNSIYTDDEPVSITAYSITASKDEVTRDPASWTLEGSNTGREWTTLDSQTDQTFSNRYATQFYLTETDEAFSYYRLTITNVNGGNQLQIAELQLLSVEAVDPTGINSIANKQQTTDCMYNLAGQRLSKLQKGINIVSGRKILIK